MEIHMRKLKIIADSSADILSLNDIDFTSVPLKIMTDKREFIDNEDLSVSEMVDFLDHYKGKSKSSCPNADEWLSAFGDADDIICVTITSALSGSYNAACSAKQIYEDEHNDRRVFVVDSLSAGPELRLIIEKLQEYAKEGVAYDEMCEKIKAYQQKTGLIFMLKSLKNFANNGRVSPVLAKIVGLVGICIVGRASDKGELDPTDKCRGEIKSLSKVVECLKESGLSKGRVVISHCQNEKGALSLKASISEKIPQAKVEICECRGLCSFYAEKGGILVGFEKM